MPKKSNKQQKKTSITLSQKLWDNIFSFYPTKIFRFISQRTERKNPFKKQKQWNISPFNLKEALNANLMAQTELINKFIYIKIQLIKLQYYLRHLWSW